ncbi:family 20 glycosylhydrolase [Zobellia uliginosa]|uniref:family 20 glycosylhydrolase n=1 Tax=Zobellia uliginosa TaxID=143224 RepID=UPI0026E2DF3A|nr:family 20 glycosylhydrolase [Zobellia uliginosa]MDO6516523.1 family 20 glycosylhydrolase [Zobellia uliginosa]
MKLFKQFFTFYFFCGVTFGYGQKPKASIVPAPKSILEHNELFCAEQKIGVYWDDDELYGLYEVLKDEFFTLTGEQMYRSTSQENSMLVMGISGSLNKEEYQIDFNNKIQIKGGSYDAVALASTTILQYITINQNKVCWNKGNIHDFPDFNFRAVLLDVARKKHDIATIKRIISLCRWYKVNYLQLHLTDNQAFTFPSKTYPNLATKNWAYSREELIDLVAYADTRGVELIPELEVPGHAGQLISILPNVFGFKNKKLNLNTVNMANVKGYEVLETLFQEVAQIFKTSKYIHIGGDEANFRGMNEDLEIQEYLKENDLKNVDELYWHFINRMNELVKKTGKKTIVWEGFSKEGNTVINKGITVMAWETLYQLPEDILNAGFSTINVSWKPLYVVNQRKWTPEKIFNWNIYRWENFYPKAPSFRSIQLEVHPGVKGAMMASWEQPAFVELSSLRNRVPAMIEESWGRSKKVSYSKFIKNLEKTDARLSTLLSPVKIEIKGLTYPEVKDGRKNQQIWFNNELVIKLKNERDLEIRYSLEGSEVTSSSSKYTSPVTIRESTEIRYRAFKGEEPVGNEMLEYFELQPLDVHLAGDFSIPLNELWETLHPDTVRYRDSVKVTIESRMKGVIKYKLGEGELTESSDFYSLPLIIKDDVILKAGLFSNGKIIGEPWVLKFKKDKD